MASRLIERVSQGSASVLFARLGGLRLRDHGHVAALATASGSDVARDLADFVHLLCALHGNPPGFLGQACLSAPEEEARPWLSEAADAFEPERTYLVQLSAAVGPIPSTPGATETETALNAQRNALEALAGSERRGCALGAAAMFVDQWHGLRPLLDRAAERIGIDPPPLRLAERDSAARLVELACPDPATGRAVAFGAEQLLLQHHALFDLLEARAGARRDC